jgi:hypothetical protein
MVVVHVDGVRLSLNCGLLFISRMIYIYIYEYGDPGWNDTDRGKLKKSKNCPTATASAVKHTN